MKFKTIASDCPLPEKFLTFIVHDPDVGLLASTWYVNDVAPPATTTIGRSFGAINVLFNVNATVLFAAKFSLFIVICPVVLFKVTAVDLLVN